MWSPDEIDTSLEAVDWAASGALALTGRSDGPPLTPTGAPASVARAALDRVAALAPGASLPGVEVLGERAALAGLTRGAPWSAGRHFRTLPASDGWIGLSLARPSDLDLLPALVEGAVHEPWEAVADWLSGVTAEDAESRFALLGLPGAAVPTTLCPPRRPAVRPSYGAPRVPRSRPLVVDLTSLWAGPLCARLLGATGARIVKVEHSGRLDGARRSPTGFYDLLHTGHESVVLDFRSTAGLTALRALVAAADVVLEASRPRALRQLGIHAEDHVRAGTVWLSITSRGRDGADGLRVGFGDDVAAGAGLVALEDGVPLVAADALADPLTGVVGAANVLEALAAGRGCLLDLSMHDLAAFAAALPRPGVHAHPAGTPAVGARAPWVGTGAADPAAPAGADTERVLIEFT